MREATDLAISAGIRRELSGRRIDLSKLKFPVKAGVVSLQGELCFVGLEKTADETAVELKFIESSLKNLPGVKEIVFELTNWSKNDSGIWESASAAQTSGGGGAPVLDGEGIVCPDCDYVIRFCPCCGKPLAGAAKSGNARPRRPVMPVKPILKKKRPASPLLSPVVRPVTPGTPVVVAPEALKNLPGNISPAKPSASPAQPPARAGETVAPVRPAPTADIPKPPAVSPVKPAAPDAFAAKPASPPVSSAVPPTARVPAPAAVANPTVSAVKPAPATGPAVKSNLPQPAAKPQTPQQPFHDSHGLPETPAVTPVPAKPAPQPVKPAQAMPPASDVRKTEQPPVFAGPEMPVAEELPEDDIDTPDFSKFTLGGSESPANKAGSPELDNLFGSLKTEIPGLETDLPTESEPTVPVTPIPTQPPRQASPAKPAASPAAPQPPKASVPDFNFDALISGSDTDLGLPGGETADETPAFDLGSLGQLEPQAPAEDEDTPLPPIRQTGGKPAAEAKPATRPAAPPPTDVFEDDDTPLPPMRPQTPPKDAKGGKDLFASLFSDGDLNLGLPANQGSGQNKNPFGNLDLELDVLEVFPNDDAPTLAPSPAPGKKPPAPAKPAPADDNPFNLDNIIDLDSPVEEKSPSKKKGIKDPLDLDDFDISKFKL